MKAKTIFTFLVIAFLFSCDNKYVKDYLEDTRAVFESDAQVSKLTEDGINDILMRKYSSRYRVLTDADRKWYESDMKIVNEQRKKYQYFPYIVRGDFNGDKILDFAVIVKNTENSKEELIVIWGNDNSIRFVDANAGEGISLFRLGKEDVKSYWENNSIHLIGDGIIGEYFEKSSWLIYWDGNSFKTYWMSD